MSFGTPEVVNLLVEHMDFAPNEKDFEGRTSLLIAIGRSDAHTLVPILLKKGADPRQADKHGRSPLHEAVRAGHQGVVDALLDAGGDPNARDIQERTPLHDATERGYARIAEALLKAGASPNLPYPDGRVPLHQAITDGSLSMVVALLEAGANPNYRFPNGDFPLSKAKSQNVKSALRNRGGKLREEKLRGCCINDRILKQVCVTHIYPYLINNKVIPKDTTDYSRDVEGARCSCYLEYFGQFTTNISQGAICLSDDRHDSSDFIR